MAATTGCELFPESSFELASISRLPRWVSLPPGTARANVSFTLNYYIKSSGPAAEFILRDAKKKVISKKWGKLICTEPRKLKVHSQNAILDYPAYEPITVDGVTDIIEHKKMEPIFYISDDAAIWKQYESTGCN